MWPFVYVYGFCFIRNMRLVLWPSIKNYFILKFWKPPRNSKYLRVFIFCSSAALHHLVPHLCAPCVPFFPLCLFTSPLFPLHVNVTLSQSTNHNMLFLLKGSILFSHCLETEPYPLSWSIDDAVIAVIL